MSRAQQLLQKSYGGYSEQYVQYPRQPTTGAGPNVASRLLQQSGSGGSGGQTGAVGGTIGEVKFAVVPPTRIEEGPKLLPPSSTRISEADLKMATIRAEAGADSAPPPTMTGSRGFSGTQKFDVLAQQVRRSGKLFEDWEFPPDTKSIKIQLQQDPQGNVTFDPRQVVWKRPTELVKSPKFMVDDATRFDIVQGSVLGDCWLLASIACLSLYKDLLGQVVVAGQDFDQNYCGLFHFRLFHYGKWMDVCIDDRLPTINGELIFVKSNANNEYWSALLEKAYAKLIGSYGALEAGQAGEALQDLTGGLLEKNELNSMSPEELNDLFDVLLKYQSRATLMSASIRGEGSGESQLSNGLVAGHAYSLTGVRKFKTRSGEELNLVRLRNPWGAAFGGQQTEWQGPWRDNGPEWARISAEEKAAAQLNFENDGEFWMSFDDFKANFTSLDICHLTENTIEGNDSYWTGGSGALSTIRQMLLKQKTTWNFDMEFSAWRTNASAGGFMSVKNPQTGKAMRNQQFAMNPQFRMEVVAPDTGENEGLLVVGVMQKDNRMKRIETGVDLNYIGYCIFNGDNTSGLVGRTFFETARPLNKVSFSNVREMSGRHPLPPGQYIVVPCTPEPNIEGEFLIRIFAEKKQSIKEADQATQVVPIVSEIAEGEVDAVKKLLKKMWPFFAGTDGLITGFDLRDIISAVFSGTIPPRFASKIQPNELQWLTNAMAQLTAVWTAEGGKNLKIPSRDTCRSFVALFDVNSDGKMGLDEFRSFLKFCNQWKKVFLENDKDGNGTLSTYEMRDALAKIGFVLSNRNFNSIMQRYPNEDGSIDLDDFLLVAARLMLAFDTYKKVPKVNAQGAESMQIGFEQFMQTMLYS